MPKATTISGSRSSKKKVVKTPRSSPDIFRCILSLRDVRVMLDADLAELYDVTTGNLNKAVQRNLNRFPADFMFQLSKTEFEGLEFQIGRSSLHGGRRTLPFAFTQERIAMLSGILRSDRAVQVNIAIMREFVQMRSLLNSQSELASKLGLLERKIDSQDDEITTIFKVLRQLVETPVTSKRKIGFKTDQP